MDESLRQIPEEASIEKAPSNIIEIVPEEEQKIPFHQQRMPAYQGKQFTEEELDSALYDMDPWITFERFDNDEALIADAAEAINSGKVISWFQGRSEFGQRALGSRSVHVRSKHFAFNFIPYVCTVCIHNPVYCVCF